MRITKSELIVYGPDLAEIARHELYPSGTTGEKHSLPEHSPGRDHYHKYQLLKERFAELEQKRSGSWTGSYKPGGVERMKPSGCSGSWVPISARTW